MLEIVMGSFTVSGNFELYFCLYFGLFFGLHSYGLMSYLPSLRSMSFTSSCMLLVIMSGKTYGKSYGQKIVIVCGIDSAYSSPLSEVPLASVTVPTVYTNFLFLLPNLFSEGSPTSNVQLSL